MVIDVKQIKEKRKEKNKPDVDLEARQDKTRQGGEEVRREGRGLRSIVA